ncbi:MAG: hydantoinase/oxoprolinase family protein, partial [Solirubrobacteraceae bacterium]
VEIGAGGGSIAWVDAGGSIRVGPRSAGAEPGPACYGRGGTEPTVTDANLLLGRLSADAPLAGGIALDLDAARRAVSALGASLGLELQRCAEGIVAVANAEMVRALRVVTVQRGIDPRRFALLAFGGAGPLHAAAIADELGISRIVCPRASGVLAALGLVVSPRRRDVQRSVMLAGGSLSTGSVAEVIAELGERARAELGEPRADLRAICELRYRGQAFELPVPAGAEASPAELRERFEAAHEERYGYRDAEQELELVTVRVSATVPGADVALAVQPGDGPAPGTRIAGPATVGLPESTVFVPAGWAGEVDAVGTIRLRRRHGRG